MLLSCVFPSFAGEAGIRLTKMSKAFAKSATAAGLNNPSLAILPYSADRKLSARHVDEACTQLVITRFMSDGSFKVLDRSQTGGGASELDTQSAARMGKQAGAKLALFGSVTRLGSQYHLSTTLVNADSGEVVDSDVTEIPVPVLEEDASRYIVAEADDQTVGLYLTFAGGPLKVANTPPSTFSSTTIFPANPKSSLMAAGVGARYFPWANWMFDLTAFLHAEFTPDAMLYSMNPPPQGGQRVQEASIRSDGPMARLTLNRVVHLFGPFRAIVGAGALVMSMKQQDNGNHNSIYNGNITVYPGNNDKSDYFTPTARLGLEWKVQKRLGLSVFGNYNFKKLEYTDTIQINGPQQQMVVRRMEYPQVFADAALSLYF